MIYSGSSCLHFYCVKTFLTKELLLSICDINQALLIKSFKLILEFHTVHLCGTSSVMQNYHKWTGYLRKKKLLIYEKKTFSVDSELRWISLATVSLNSVELLDLVSLCFFPLYFRLWIPITTLLIISPNFAFNWNQLIF